MAKVKRRMTLAELRKGRKISQATVAEALGIGQMQISRLEKRKDPRLSTMQRTVAAMGGHLTMIATFPDQELQPWPAASSAVVAMLALVVTVWRDIIRDRPKLIADAHFSPSIGGGLLLSLSAVNTGRRPISVIGWIVRSRNSRYMVPSSGLFLKKLDLELQHRSWR